MEVYDFEAYERELEARHRKGTLIDRLASLRQKPQVMPPQPKTRYIELPFKTPSKKDNPSRANVRDDTKTNTTNEHSGSKFAKETALTEFSAGLQWEQYGWTEEDLGRTLCTRTNDSPQGLEEVSLFEDFTEE